MSKPKKMSEATQEEVADILHNSAKKAFAENSPKYLPFGKRTWEKSKERIEIVHPCIYGDDEEALRKELENTSGGAMARLGKAWRALGHEIWKAVPWRVKCAIWKILRMKQSGEYIADVDKFYDECGPVDWEKIEAEEVQPRQEQMLADLQTNGVAVVKTRNGYTMLCSASRPNPLRRRRVVRFSEPDNLDTDGEEDVPSLMRPRTAFIDEVAHISDADIERFASIKPKPIKREHPFDMPDDCNSMAIGMGMPDAAERAAMPPEELAEFRKEWGEWHDAL